MPRLLKRVLLVIGGAAGLAVLVALAVFLFVDVDRDRPRLEAAASEALGLEVRFGGRLRLGVFPGVHLTAVNAQARDERDSVVVSAKRIRFGIALLPLLRGQLRLARLEIVQPRLSIVRAPDGTWNVQRLQRAAALLGMLDGASVRVTDGSLLYTDGRSGDRIEATGFDLDVSRLRLAKPKAPGLLPVRSLTAKLGCREIRTRDFAVSALKASIEGKDGLVRIAPVTMGVFGGQGTGSLRADFSGPVPRYEVRFSLPGFRIEQFLAVLSPKRAAEGAMDFTTSLSMQGASANQLVRSAAGGFSLRSGHLTLVGNDLDRVLSRFESSQSFSLVDVGAVFLAGPMGLAVTKGYGFAGLFRGSGGNTDVRVLVSDWAIEGGVARARDVALATARNRIAIQGGLDFGNETFAGLTVAAVDAHGCVRVRQVIRGSFANPAVEKPHVLASLAGPMIDAYRRTRGLFPQGPCDVFYSGSVPPPG